MNINKLAALNSFNSARLTETPSFSLKPNFTSFMNQFSQVPMEALSGNPIIENIKSLKESLKKSEKIGQNSVQGKGNLIDLVTGITETEILIQNAISIRDNALRVYKEVMSITI